MLRVIALVVGMAVLVGTTLSVVATLVIPRRSRRLTFLLRRAALEAHNAAQVSAGLAPDNLQLPSQGVLSSPIAPSRLAVVVWKLTRVVVSRRVALTIALARRWRPGWSEHEKAAGRFDPNGRALRDYETRDRVLSSEGPIGLLLLLALWVLAYVLAYGLVLWGLDTGARFGHALYLSGSSISTLGLVQPGAHHRALEEATVLLAGGTGLAIFGLTIAYLPTIYGHYNRREVLVRRLESVSASPAWGVEILWRMLDVSAIPAIGDFYAEWTAWSADVAESHTTYPWLLLFRSSDSFHSWLVALVAVLDSAAIFLSTDSAQRPDVPQAKECLRTGFTALRSIAPIFGIEHSWDPSVASDGHLLDPYRDEFMASVAKLKEKGLAADMTAEEAWPHFQGWRVNYHVIATGLAAQLIVPPAMWLGSAHPIRPLRPPHRRPTDAVGA